MAKKQPKIAKKNSPALSATSQASPATVPAANVAELDAVSVTSSKILPQRPATVYQGG